MDNTQQDFKEWVKQRFLFSITKTTFNKRFLVDGTFLEYTVHEVNYMWQGWEAAYNKDNKDVVVELPTIPMQVLDSDFKTGMFHGLRLS